MTEQMKLQEQAAYIEELEAENKVLQQGNAKSVSLALPLAERIAGALSQDREVEGYDLEAGIFGLEFSKIVRCFAELEAENARLKKDSERLDFLKKRCDDIKILGYDNEHFYIKEEVYDRVNERWYELSYASSKTIDGAIDNAMKVKGVLSDN